MCDIHSSLQSSREQLIPRCAAIRCTRQRQAGRHQAGRLQACQAANVRAGPPSGRYCTVLRYATKATLCAELEVTVREHVVMAIASEHGNRCIERQPTATRTASHRTIMSSNIYQHRTLVPAAAPVAPAGQANSTARLNDLLEFVKHEFDVVLAEGGQLKGQRDDYEHRSE